MLAERSPLDLSGPSSVSASLTGSADLARSRHPSKPFSSAGPSTKLGALPPFRSVSSSLSLACQRSLSCRLSPASHRSCSRSSPLEVLRDFLFVFSRSVYDPAWIGLHHPGKGESQKCSSPCHTHRSPLWRLCFLVCLRSPPVWISGFPLVGVSGSF